MDINLFDYIFQNMGGAIAILALVVITVVSVRFAFTVNINDLIKQRKHRNLMKAQMLCPHFYFTGKSEGLSDKNGAFEYQSLLKSPPGTIMWHCAKCGAMFPDGNIVETERLAGYYLDGHLKEYFKTIKKTDKYIRKSL